MKSAERIQKEIDALKSMIEVLNRCTIIFKKEKKIESLISNLSDLAKCKAELKRLIEERESALVAEGEPASDAL
jgi:archaellum component FlaC